MVSALVVLAMAGILSPLFVRAGRWGTAMLAVAPAYGFSWLVGLILTDELHHEIVVRTPWVPTLGVDFALRLDGLSAFFGLLILGIGTFIVIYAGSYLHGNKDLGRFYVTLFAFMASMLGLVLADDALLMFVFWEGTSLSSYLLIGFEHEKESARVAARKALVITGAGGLALLGGFILLNDITGTWAVSDWLSQRELILGHELAPWVFALIILGAFTKSAQVPFHFWLPAAMAGPTPVSAYLHSATMVKAGVFLLARFSPVFSGTPGWIWTLTVFGAATMLFSAWAALRERDLKTVLAFTTTMALGLLVMLLGVGGKYSVIAAMGYLLVHALYKGCLFMMAGTVDHGTHTRDLDKLSGIGRKMPYTAYAAVLACASMAGLPPFIGFVGKELWYEANLHAGQLGLWVLGVSILANAALFAVAGLLTIRTFFGPPSEAAEHAHEGDIALLAGPVTLATLGLVFGLAPFLLDGLIEAASSAVYGHEAHVHLAIWHGFGAALAASGLTFLLGFVVYRFSDAIRRAGWFRAFAGAFVDGAPHLFERTFLAGAQVMSAVSRNVYMGRLRHYVLVTVLAMGLSGIIVLAMTEGLRIPEFTGMLPHEVVLVGLLVVSSLVATFVEPAMRAIISVGISGSCVALIYLLFGAPDVAMTQFAIETLTVILVVLTLLHLPSAAFQRSRRRDVARDVLVSVLVGGFLSAVLLGVLASPLPMEVSDAYLSQSVPKAHGHNVVNVILVDFRGFDTWGEITVLTIAGLGVYALLRRKARWTGLGAVPRTFNEGDAE